MPQAAAAPTVAGKAQALAQESEAATIKLQDDDEESGTDVLEELDKKAAKSGKERDFLSFDGNLFFYTWQRLQSSG